MKIRFQSEKIITIFRPFFLFFCLTGFLFPGGTIAFAEAAGPGWQTATAQPVSHEEAMRYLAERAKTLHITRIKPQVKAPAPSSGNGIQPKSATTITDPIADLAHGLNNDPKLIFDYVHNHIDYVPYYGSLKGATLTLLDGAGNDCDQAALLIALLRQAGYTAQFRYGSMDIPYTDLANWLGVANNINLIGTVLGSGGIPASVYSNTDFARVDRFWVQAVIDGTTYQFDPSWKAYTEQSGIDIGSAMGYDQSTLLSEVTNGATVTSTYTNNLDEKALSWNLTAYTGNLVNTIKNQHPNATVADIVGGRKIVQSRLSAYVDAMPTYPTSNIQTFNEVPDGINSSTNYTTTIHIRHHGIDKIFITPDIAGRRLTLTYDSDHLPHLNLDGVSVAMGTAVNTDEPQDLEIFIDHPYFSNTNSKYMDQGASDDTSFCTAGNGHCLPPYKVKRRVIYEDDTYGETTYALITAFGATNDNLLAYRQKKLDQYLAEGLSNTEEKVLGETLNIMGLTWMKECTLSDQLKDAGTIRVKHHRMGVMAQEEGYYVDVKIQSQSMVPRQDPDQDSFPSFYSSNFLISGFEHGMLEQLMGSDKPGASTIKLLNIANSAEMNIYWADSTTYGSIQNSLQHYSPQDLATFQGKVNDGHTLILPRDAHLHVGNWTGKGYIDKYQSGDSGSIGMIIGGNYSGGYAGYQGPTNPPEVNHTTQTNVQSTPRPANITQTVHTTPTVTSAEPVDMASGAYLSDHTDLAVGLNAKMPLALHRSYTSAANLRKVDNHGFAHGWAHNYDIRLEEGSAGNPVLGLRTPVDAASMIVAQHVILDLLQHEDNIKGWMIAALTAKWAIDRVIDNVVTIHFGNKAMQFVEQVGEPLIKPNPKPVRYFHSPPGITAQLTQYYNGKTDTTTYTLRERNGSIMEFSKVSDKKYRISYQQDADGNRINFVYSSGDKLTTVSNTFGHSLTLHYSGDYITSVSDSTGRSVSYGYTGTDLTSFTDPDAKLWHYGYDADHRITSLKNPLNTTTATNTYNGQGQVIHQTVPRQSGGNKTYNYYFSGFRNAEQDPDGNFLVYYFDKKGRSIGEENQLGFTTSRKYDGQDHIVQSTDFRNQVTSFTYDGHNNLIKVTNALNKETINTYDSGFHLIKTTDPLAHTADFAYDGKHHPVSSTVYPAPGQSIATTTAYYANGKVLKTTDGRGVPTFLSYDGYGNPKTSRINGQKQVTYQYDALGRLLKLTDQENNTTQFQYNDRGLVTRKTDPFGRITSYSYNDDGTVHSRSDRNGNTTTYSYTPTGKVDTISYQDGSTVHFTYDQHDRLHTMTDSLGTTTYTRDVAGRVVSVTDAGGNTVGYTYDENGYTGLLTSLTYPGDKQVQYTYDALNRLKTVTNWLGQTATYTYDDAGRLVSLVNFNGVVTTYSHDNANRLTGLVAKRADDSILYSFGYTLDKNGNRTTIDKQVPLPAPLEGRNQSADYVHNRLTATDAGLYSYDSEGQLKTREKGETTSYSFDTAYRLTGIGDDTTFSYDGSGNRLSAVSNGVETRYIYDAKGNLLAEADTDNVITRYYIHGDGLLAAITPEDDTYCYHYDGTGNTVALTDHTQNVVNAYDYSPFGMILRESETFAQPFKYVGKLGVMAEDNGLYYMRARYYDPEVGRFISEDPLGFDGGDVNLYVYGSNNPVLLVDPWGLWTLQVGLSGSGGAGGGGTYGRGFIMGYSGETGLQFGSYRTTGAGGYSGGGGSVVIDVSISDNNSIHAVAGRGAQVGYSVNPNPAVPVTFGQEFTINEGAAPSSTYSLGLGAGTPVETHGYLTNTTVNQWGGGQGGSGK